MRSESELRVALEDILAQLWCARRSADFGRLAHVGFSEVQRWAHSAGDSLLASRARELLANCPYACRDDLLWAADELISAVEFAHAQLAAAATMGTQPPLVRHAA